MISAVLPRGLAIRNCPDLVRVGSKNDGGYLVSAADIQNSDILIGLGINDDWNFEKDFATQRGCPVIAYDASVSLKHFRRKAIRALSHLSKLNRALHDYRRYVDFKNFFRGDHEHIQKFVGLDIGGGFVGFSDIVARVNGRTAFLKIDIEGYEYRILDDLIDFEPHISGCVIEFHDCDLHLDKIIGFVARFGLNLVHVHPNNHGLVNEHGIPLALELTFSHFGKCAEAPVRLPHPLDRPCKRSAEDIQLSLAS